MEHPGDSVTSRRALRVDTAAIIDLLSDAARWLNSQEISQWPYPFPSELVESSVDRGETTAVLSGEQLIGSFSIYWEDARFWGVRPPDGAYLHRLVAAEPFRGLGLGRWMIDCASDIARQNARSWLRLDCGADNMRLRRWYEDLGFSHCGDVDVDVKGAGATPGPWRAALYERPLWTDG